MKNTKTSFKSKTLIQKIATPLLLSAALTFSAITTTVNAFVVTDPASYVYYIQQLKQIVEQVNTAKNSLTQAKQLTSSFDGYMDDLRSQFDFIGDIQKSLKTQLSGFEDYKRSLSSSAKKTLDFSREFDLKNLRDIIDTNLDGIYIDPTNPDYNASEIKKLRTVERQRLLKEGLTKTEEKLALLEQKYRDIEKLTNKAKRTANPKESIDLNNTILLEILAAMHSLIEVTSTLGQAEMASKFLNHSKDEHARAERVFKRKYPKGYTVGRGKYQQNFGTKENYKKHNIKCRNFYEENGHGNTVIDGFGCPGVRKARVNNLIFGK